MPPRPRPKPRVRSGNSSQPLKEIPPSQDEEDSIFIKSGNLTTATWKQMNQIPSSHESYEGHDSCNNEEHGTSKRAGGKHSVHKRIKPPFNTGETNVLCIEDSDEECTSPMPSTNPERPGSRSTSITPPPELAPEQKMKARDLVRQALGVSHRRSVSPQSACFDRHTADDTEVFDPELVSIVLRSKKNIGSPLPRTGGDNHPQEVIINVQWRYHPSEGQKPPRWTFHVNRSDKLRQVFKEVADAMEVPIEKIVFTLKGHRIYSSVSPAALGIWSDGDFDAYLGENYEVLKDNHLRAPSGSRAAAVEGDESGEGSSDGGSIGDVAEDTFKLTLRSVKTPKGIVLTVRPQTKCGAIVKAYLRKAGLANGYLEYETSTRVRSRGRRSIVIASGPRLVVDGDKLDNEAEIKEADVEDGDIIEVTGL